MRARTRFTTAVIATLAAATVASCVPPGPGPSHPAPTIPPPAGGQVDNARRTNGQVFTVTSTSGSPAVAGSLPWAVDRANANGASVDEIRFDLPGSGPHQIDISAELGIVQPVTIDARTQRGYSGQPLVWVQGTAGVTSLFLNRASGTTIRGFGMLWYANNGVTLLPGGHGNVVADNWIGFRWTNRLYKNLELSPFSAAIGIASDDNLVHGNTLSGVYNAIVVGEAVERPWSGATYERNRFQHNRVGTDPSGTGVFGNSSDGIFFGAGARNSTVGPGNVFGGNGSTGVEIFHSSNTGIVVDQNRIGSDVAGTNALPNGDLGVQISEGASHNSVTNNLISANAKGGVAIGSGASGNWVIGNVIGPDAGQTRSLGFQNVGVSINTRGNSNTLRGNVIAGHREHGVIVADADGNGIYDNWIGRSASGTPITNGAFGVYLMRTSGTWLERNAFGANTLGMLGEDATRGTIFR